MTVPYNEARYGRSNGFPCDDVVCDNTWNLVEDGMNNWVAAPRRGRPHARRRSRPSCATFDIYDRYDFDGDGNFNEPDGYIDHLQIVHAGGDQADGDPYQGEDAIWSHRWYAFVTDAGITGPATNPLGGKQVGDTGIWAGDYTIQAENGGLSTIAHEYGHDLGLPGPLRHRRRREQRRVVEPDGAEPPVRQGRAHRHPARRPVRLGQAPARLARLRDHRGRPDPHARARAARVQLGQGPGLGPRPAREDRDVRVRRSVRRRAACGGRAAATTSATR